MNVAPLLQPRVPADADVGEPRDLLPAKAGSAPASPLRQSNVGGSNLRAAAAKELRKLSAGRHGAENNGRSRSQVRSSCSTITRVPPTTGMKFVSPIQRGTACQCR